MMRARTQESETGPSSWPGRRELNRSLSDKPCRRKEEGEEEAEDQVGVWWGR